jgi:hypothetical protein
MPRLKTTLAYVPSTRPAPPSLLRQLAYREHTLLPGPESDPDGWKTLHPVVIRGSIFNARHVSATCKVSLLNASSVETLQPSTIIALDR